MNHLPSPQPAFRDLLWCDRKSCVQERCCTGRRHGQVVRLRPVLHRETARTDGDLIQTVIGQPSFGRSSNTVEC
ncbi:hypothetical protein LEMLEM_LOCUS8670 [Lemmus lemmus]